MESKKYFQKAIDLNYAAGYAAMGECLHQEFSVTDFSHLTYAKQGKKYRAYIDRIDNYYIQAIEKGHAPAHLKLARIFAVS